MDGKNNLGIGYRVSRSQDKEKKVKEKRQKVKKTKNVKLCRFRNVDSSPLNQDNILKEDPKI